MGSEPFVWYFLGWLVAALVVILLIWGASELVAWGIGALRSRGNKAQGATEDYAASAIQALPLDGVFGKKLETSAAEEPEESKVALNGSRGVRP